jgi:serine/threonine-protein kinase RsbT
MPADLKIRISDESSIVEARQRVRLLARSLGFGVVDQSRIATAVSELTRNVVRYATGGRGELVVRELHSPDKRKGVEIVVRDDGPGIADVNVALRDGYSSGRGMGLGLPGTKRLMDEMHVDSAPGRGTTVTIRKWCR